MVDWQEVNALAVKLMKRRKEHKQQMASTFSEKARESLMRGG